MHNEILITDIETTGFSKRTDKIVEVGIVKLNVETGSKAILFDKLLKPPGLQVKDSTAWIFDKGYINFEDVVNAENLQDNLEEIQSIINQYEAGITAYKNDFDFGFFEAEGIEIPNKLPCPMKLSRNVCQIEGKRGIKNPNVQEAWDFFFPGTGYVEKHRGADDAWHEADIVFELIKRGVFKLN